MIVDLFAGGSGASTTDQRLNIIKGVLDAEGITYHALSDCMINVPMAGDGGGLCIFIAQTWREASTIVRLPLGETETTAKLELLLRLQHATIARLG